MLAGGSVLWLTSRSEAQPNSRKTSFQVFTHWEALIGKKLLVSHRNENVYGPSI